MKIKMISLFFTLLLALTAGSLVYASPPGESGTVSGDFVFGPSTTVVSNGNINIFTRCCSSLLGDVEGSFESVMARAFSMPDGTVRTNGTLASEITKLDGTSVVGTIMWKVEQTSVGLVTTGTYKWYNGTGDLKGVHGSGTFLVDLTIFSFTYDGSYSGFTLP